MNIERRQFLQAAGSALALAGVQQAEAADDDFGGFTLGVQTYSFRNFDLEPALKRIQDLGLKHAEFYQKHAPLESSPKQIKAFLKICGDYGITPVAWGVQRFGKNHDANKRVFEFGKALGLKGFSASPSVDAFDSLDKLCEEYKIAVGIHPHGPIGGKKLDHWYSAEIILDAVKNHNPLIGGWIDTGHIIRCAQLDKKLDPAQQVRVLGKRNFGLHLKDHDNKQRRDVVFGKGVLDVPAVLKALRDVNFKGYINIEYEANPANPSPDMKECVAVFKQAAKA